MEWSQNGLPETNTATPLLLEIQKQSVWKMQECIVSVSKCIRDLNNYWEEGLFHDLVDEVFHSQLLKCEKEEEKYFLEHDEYSILKKKFRNRKHHTTFGVHIGTWSNGMVTINGDSDGEERDITMEELKDLLAKYDQLDALVEKLTAETDIVY